MSEAEAIEGEQPAFLSIVERERAEASPSKENPNPAPPASESKVGIVLVLHLSIFHSYVYSRVLHTLLYRESSLDYFYPLSLSSISQSSSIMGLWSLLGLGLN